VDGLSPPAKEESVSLYLFGQGSLGAPNPTIRNYVLSFSLSFLKETREVRGGLVGEPGDIQGTCMRGGNGGEDEIALHSTPRNHQRKRKKEKKDSGPTTFFHGACLLLSYFQVNEGKIRKRISENILSEMASGSLSSLPLLCSEMEGVQTRPSTGKKRKEK